MTMKTCYLMILGSVLCQRDEIVRNDFDGPYEDGSFKWALQTEGGIYHEQRSTPRQQAPLIEGQYQYIAPDGQVIRVLYTADEFGFHPTGDHLPTPPPIPPQIQRALDYVARLRDNRI
ncbi:endocuticle structural glycoprotein SgAbd-8-like isoform X2 [Danaus plexippus]|uniref:endocuticle structural glycoprotein SgAbd-8-like isoform X2 n=1 Tax=Danaus plexippus TaxID=13037 RepID=UPI002AB01B55|nr:endocuticle structural glycoprotein SgAbd-8-like isoform X2 [Danaus plexippus]